MRCDVLLTVPLGAYGGICGFKGMSNHHRAKNDPHQFVQLCFIFLKAGIETQVKGFGVDGIRCLSSLDVRSIGAGLRVTVRDHPWGVARDMGRSQGNTSSRRLVRARFLNSTRLGVVFARNPISLSLPLSPTSPIQLSLFIPEHKERQRLNSTQLFVASFWSNETKASEHRSSWTPPLR